MTGGPWWAWAVLAAVVALAELHAPGSYLIWIALGAAVTAGLVANDPAGTLEWQLGVFAAAAAASCVLGWFVYRALRGHKSGDDLLNRRGQQLVGLHARVAEAFVNGSGKVQVGDTQWLADGPDLAAGDSVVIVEVRGARLVVRGTREAG